MNPIKNYTRAAMALVICLITAGVTAVTIALLIMEIADTRIVVSGIVGMVVAFITGDYAARQVAAVTS